MCSRQMRHDRASEEEELRKDWIFERSAVRPRTGCRRGGRRRSRVQSMTRWGIRYSNALKANGAQQDVEGGGVKEGLDLRKVCGGGRLVGEVEVRPEDGGKEVHMKYGKEA
ncbi:hypothetical protein CDL15_Pgr001282 [Punica granatum]|uniref:Uncharacterized protein n=1 Tax=Punica granatum TaxID=22663 RepID=A0A218WKY3_PUNGR|nr:hypothetical protein CDL15_Pgr001282 [Punica granatum]